MRARVPRRVLAALAERVVQQLPAFARHVGGALERCTEAVQLACDVVEGRLDLTPQLASPIREEQIARHAPDDCPDDGCCYSFVAHAGLLIGLWISSCVPRTLAAEDAPRWAEFGRSSSRHKSGC